MSVQRTGSLEAAIARLASLDATRVTVGLQGTPATTASGEASASELVRIATANHYGTRTIPPRPFLTTSLRRNGKAWTRFMRAAAQHKARGQSQAATRQLRLLGLKAVGDTQAALRDGPWAPNADATVRRKGSNRPLVDTGQMVQSIRSAVEVPGRSPEMVG